MKVEPPAGDALISSGNVSLRELCHEHASFEHTFRGKHHDILNLSTSSQMFKMLKVYRERVGRSELQEQIERSRYMERILKRTIEGIRLDTTSLAKMADALDADASDPKEIEGLVIDEEACTMDPVGDTTTRSLNDDRYL